MPTALLALASCAWLSGDPGPGVYALRYGTLRGFPEHKLLRDGDPAERADIALMVWLVRTGDRNVLVDSGFHRADVVDRWDPRGFVRPDEVVARAGVDADEVTDVIVTHLHWDHAGGLDLFPNAHVWIQRAELERYRNADPRTGVLREDVAVVEQRLADGRATLLDGDGAVAPGITAHAGSAHTVGSQFVSVVVGGDTVVLASDGVALYEGLDRHVASGTTVDADANLRAQDQMRSLAAAPELVIPGHDPEVMRRFPRVAPGVVKIR